MKVFIVLAAIVAAVAAAPQYPEMSYNAYNMPQEPRYEAYNAQPQYEAQYQYQPQYQSQSQGEQLSADGYKIVPGVVDARCPRADDPMKPVHLAVNGNCGKFMKCFGGRAYEMDCPAGLEFGAKSALSSLATASRQRRIVATTILHIELQPNRTVHLIGAATEALHKLATVTRARQMNRLQRIIRSWAPSINNADGRFVLWSWLLFNALFLLIIPGRAVHYELLQRHLETVVSLLQLCPPFSRATDEIVIVAAALFHIVLQSLRAAHLVRHTGRTHQKTVTVRRMRQMYRLFRIIDSGTAWITG
uniref:Chitin-binding type-2 domain-containing protein n=1 Tax=Anopheles culicifacies TaxID=139723 RepID=A0A182LW10_9DIPT